MIFRVDVKNSFGEWVEVMNTFGCYESDNFKTLIKAKDLMAHLKSVGCLESDMRVIKTKDNYKIIVDCVFSVNTVLT